MSPAERQAAARAAEEVAAERAERERVAAVERAERERANAASELAAAMSRSGDALLQPLLAAIAVARGKGVSAEDIARAEAVHQAAVQEAREREVLRQRDAAKRAAERRRQEEMRVEMEAAKEALRKSVTLSGPERKKTIRALQARWHPDRVYGDAQATAFSQELSQLINAQAKIARDNENAIKSKRDRETAYLELQASMNAGSMFGRGEVDVPRLRAAIETARRAGVSDAEVKKAEAKLRAA